MARDIRKYAERICGKGNIIHSAVSDYYRFGGNKNNILRISDHIGSNSDGRMSIIETEDDNTYVIHCHENGRLQIVNYKKAQEIIRNFALLSNVFVGSPTFKDRISPNTVLGVEIDLFPEKDKEYIKKIAKERRQFVKKCD